MKLKLVYKGGGSLPNVPARDLTQADIDRWRVDVEACIASGLYEIPPQPKKAVKKDGEESE